MADAIGGIFDEPEDSALIAVETANYDDEETVEDTMEECNASEISST